MALTAGTRLGPYEILAPLGAGGMGEVYRARDGRLDRDVAIKVLPPLFASDPDRRARFEREAKAVAALSHPNILAIHDVGSEGPTTYAVTELLDGETLRERLKRADALPARKALEIAAQIARGLAAAHAKGIVHRDLKPENVFLLKDGHVKILDFGLARQTALSQGSGATETVAASDPGVVMGTVGYMAPEQVRGQPLDARADLFALGAVIYEMLTGRRAFQRDTAAETMTAILKEDPPDLTSARADLPPALDRIVRHCLEKSPTERFESARDVAFALESLSGSSAGSGAAAAIPAPRASRRGWLVVAGITAGAAIGLLAGWRVFARADAPIAFETKTWDPQWIVNARFGADGDTMLFSAVRTSNVPSVFLIRPDSLSPQPVGPPGTHLLAVSTKGELAVLTDAKLLYHRVFIGTLARMAADSAPRAWLENVRDADWSPDGSTIAVVHVVGGKNQLEYPIGQMLHQTTGYLSDLRVSPSGDQVAFFEHAIPIDDRGWVKVVDRSGHVRTMTEEYSALEGLAWSTDGQSLYFSGMLGQTTDFRPFVVRASGPGTVQPAFSSAGDIVVFDTTKSGRTLMAREEGYRGLRGVAPNDTTEKDFGWQNFSVAAYFSGDGRLLTFTDVGPTTGEDYDVILRHTDGSGVARLGPGAAQAIAFGGKHVLSILPSSQQLLLYPTGAGAAIKLDRGPVASYRYAGQWLPGDRSVLVCGSTSAGVSRCYTQAIDGGSPVPVTAEGCDQALLAPDGRTLFVHSLSGGYVVGALGSLETHPAKGLVEGDVPLAWSRDARAIFVQAGQLVPARVERVDITTGARTLARELGPPDRSGLSSITVDQWIDDGRAYAYSYMRTLSRLVVASRGK
jgi:hypothetical protein